MNRLELGLLAATLTLTLGACGDGAVDPVRPDQPSAASIAPRPAAVAIDAAAVASELVDIRAGLYRPLFGKDVDRVSVAPFRIERHAVTNAQFLAFVRANPQWQRNHVKRLFADDGYLALWESDLEPGTQLADQPVVLVSWFAARAYAHWIGRRLPTTAEWELAAADFDESETELTRRILDWYAKPTTAGSRAVGSGIANRAGVLDLHGLVWEWVDDFNQALVTGESRADPGLDRTLFCGSGAVNAANPSDYAAFMRYAMRSSLRAGYTVKHLGFRCAMTAGDQAEEASCCAGDELEAAAPLPGKSVWQLESSWRDQRGTTRRLAEFRGKPTLVAMIFTHCRYACPRIATDVKRIADALPPAERDRIHGLFVSIDPDRDTPERLTAFAAEHGLDAGRLTLLCCPADDVHELAAALGVSYQRAESGDFAHSNVVNLLDAEGIVAHRQEGLEVDPIGTVTAARGLLREPR